MIRKQVKLLVIGDSELECECDDITIDNLTFEQISFNESDLIGYDLIVYSGKKGTKILKSQYFKSGKIE